MASYLSGGRAGYESVDGVDTADVAGLPHSAASSGSSEGSGSLWKKLGLGVLAVVAIAATVRAAGSSNSSTSAPRAAAPEYSDAASKTTSLSHKVTSVEDSSSLEHFDKLGRYVIPNYDTIKPFASFLPGLAGKYGTPMWAFYVNRGQIMAAFGIENKEHPLLEFEPANLAYQQIPRTGFRTFLRAQRKEEETEFVFEPFKVGTPDVSRSIFVGMNEVEIQEEDDNVGLQTNVLYYTVHEEEFPGLVRRTTVKNTGDTPISFEMLDGLARLQPYGVFDYYIKSMDRTVEAWMTAYNMNDMGHGTLPYYKLSASIVDSEVVTMIIPGNYALGYLEDDKTGKDSSHGLLPMIVDPSIVFGQDTTFTNPLGLEAVPLSELLKRKHTTTGRTPCGFAATPMLTLKPGESTTLTSIWGKANTMGELKHLIAPTVTSIGFLSAKRTEAQQLIEELTRHVKTDSASQLFDGYVQYNFMDNMLRGGYPVLLGDPKSPKIYHTFSRIHGDLERDYNYFVIAPTYYSQGPGNYRDVNQNRRSDVAWQPLVGDYNIQTFMSLLQADGYNPMTVQSVVFNITDQDRVYDIASKVVPEENVTALAGLIQPPFRPGTLFMEMKDAGLLQELSVSKETFLNLITEAAVQIPQADFSQGFWCDHWTYTQDLFESYLSIFPEKLEYLLFDSSPVPTYLSPNKVVRRKEKYVLVDAGSGKVRQLGMNVADGDKTRQLAMNANDPNGVWMCVEGTQEGGTDAPGSDPFSSLGVPTGMGKCDVFYQSVASKYTMLVAVKFALLDPLGMAIEMEGGKPGWLDALNGLPALFGSSMPEMYELHRYTTFIRTSIDKLGRDVDVFEELDGLLTGLGDCLDTYSEDADDFAYWNCSATARENYRDLTRLTLTGKTVSWSASDLVDLLDRMLEKINQGIKRASEANDGYPPSYFRWEVTEYELTGTEDAQLRPYVIAKGFEPFVLPLFLEGSVRNMKVLDTIDEKRELFETTKAGPLYDKILAMYKISENLGETTFEIGRVQGFSPGWLENESIWLHMSYKWYLEILKAGLFEEFWNEVSTGVVVFMNPEIYGRSPLECSSFLASSRYMDSSLWGGGFVSRLSGSTSEFMSMYNLMMYGPTPFTTNAKGQLQLQLVPALPGWLFKEDGTLTFTFLGMVNVTYHNPSGRDTWEDSMEVLRISMDDEEEVRGWEHVTHDAAQRIREGLIRNLDVFYRA